MKTPLPHIQFLGTGAGDYHTTAGILAGYGSNSGQAEAVKRGGKNVRHCPSLFISPDILVDFGDGTRDQLATFGIPSQRIRHVAISHVHYDHCYPEKVLDFADGQSRRLRIYGNRTVGEALDFAATYRWDDSVKQFIVHERRRHYRTKNVVLEKPIALGSVTMTPVLASHIINRHYGILEQQAFNFVFQRGGRTLFYNLDSNYLLPKTFEFLKRFRFDIAIFDATWADLTTFDIRDTGHHNFPMLDRTVAQFRSAGLLHDNARIVYSHLSTDTVPPHDETAARLAEKGVTLAYDGLTIDF